MSEPVRALLADHEEPFRQMAGDALRSAGFHCDSFRDGERAAVALQASGYDLLVVSIAMPGNRDFELLRRPGGEPLGIPVIVLAKPASCGRGRAFENYLAGLVALRRRVVADLKRELADSRLDRRPRPARSRSGRPRKRR